MSASAPIDLYNLLPALYRIRDAENGYQLRALLEIVSAQANVVKSNIDGLWDDLFIETCAPWVIPYIGDLVANNPLHDVGIGVRGDVAHTIYYRRRKGTLAMLETLARDVTRWGAHSVAFFEELGWTQNLNHERLAFPATPPPPPLPALPAADPYSVNRVGSVNLRDLDTLGKIGGPFDITTHTVDVRPVCQALGWYNIKNVGFFLWRLESNALAFVTPRKSTTYADGYHFSPLGNPAPLFTQPPLTIQDMKQIVESQAPGPIRPAAFYFFPADYYGPAPLSSFGIYDGTDPLTATLHPASKIVCRDLSGWTPPPSGSVAVDVNLGRLAFAPGESPANGLLVNFSYGFSGEMGGGPYDRDPAVNLTSPSASCDCAVAATTLTVPNTLDQPTFFGPLLQVPSGTTTTIGEAIAAWGAAGSPSGVIQINDSGTYTENLAINLPANGVLVLQSANQERPVLFGNITVNTAPGATASLFMLSGLVVAGQVHVGATLEALNIVHSTLVPGLGLDESGAPVSPDIPSLIVDDPNANLQILIDHSITGALQVPEDVLGLTVRDSIIDSPSPSAHPAIAGDTAGNLVGPPSTLERTTIFGAVRVQELVLASETIFVNPVSSVRRQTGCVRFSFVPQGSVTPRRFRCQPDLEIQTETDAAEKAAEDIGATLTVAQKNAIQKDVRAWLVPAFTDNRYGRPAYAQLAYSCPVQMKTGAEDGSEMGAFSFLKQPQRETNLRVRLQEYLPFGLQTGLIYVT